ncbi:MAG TPA: GlxA family transcriptional regulator [Phenylobacterium sp.]|nr:GlxA family transcriptional regulator [Phenylobacterium sp.]
MPENDAPANSSELRSLGLLLIDGFALMSYASVIEPYRAANMLAGNPLYRWTHISVGGGPCHASNGAMIVADQAVGEPLACHTLFVFAGGDPTGFGDAQTFGWLRQMAARGTVIAGISAGPYLLARAGLLDGYRATIHWEHRPAFAEAFPMSTPEPGLYVIDRRRVTCAGGMAGMDLALELIEREHGHALAAQVSDWFIRSEPRAADRPQRLSLRDRYGVVNDRVLKVLAHMEASVEEPSGREVLARIAGVSVRQLERLFDGHLGETVNSRYMRIRLAQADQLLRTTGLSTTTVGVACGFKSASHFSRSYRRQYGRSPSEDRSRPG